MARIQVMLPLRTSTTEATAGEPRRRERSGRRLKEVFKPTCTHTLYTKLYTASSTGLGCCLDRPREKAEACVVEEKEEEEAATGNSLSLSPSYYLCSLSLRTRTDKPCVCARPQVCARYTHMHFQQPWPSCVMYYYVRPEILFVEAVCLCLCLLRLLH